ncbi:MAG: hypothetical protein WCI38_01350 [Chthoniobacterales bacterium]
MIRISVLVAAVYLAVLVQEFIPPMPFFGDARILLVPVLFCYGALLFPFPGVIAFALYCGLVSDLSLLQVDGDHVEIGLGWTMLYYVLVSASLRILQPFLPGRRWETHCLLSGGVTLMLLLGQYLMVCLRRAALVLDADVLWQIAGPAVAALLLAPVFYLLLNILPYDAIARRRGRRNTEP